MKHTTKHKRNTNECLDCGATYPAFYGMLSPHVRQYLHKQHAGCTAGYYTGKTEEIPRMGAGDE